MTGVFDRIAQHAKHPDLTGSATIATVIQCDTMIRTHFRQTVEPQPVTRRYAVLLKHEGPDGEKEKHKKTDRSQGLGDSRDNRKGNTLAKWSEDVGRIANPSVAKLSINPCTEKSSLSWTDWQSVLRPTRISRTDAPILLHLAKQLLEKKILLLRGEKVMLDADLAELYQVETRMLVQAVKRNIERFQADFMFQLSKVEFEEWRS